MRRDRAVAEETVEARRAVYRAFFHRCAHWLPAGGRLSLQTIAYEDFDVNVGPISSFFANEIFPESGLPRLSDIVVTSDPWFRLVEFRSDAAQYEHEAGSWLARDGDTVREVAPDGTPGQEASPDDARPVAEAAEAEAG